MGQNPDSTKIDLLLSVMSELQRSKVYQQVDLKDDLAISDRPVSYRMLAGLNM